jgi:hypothetical protein
VRGAIKAEIDSNEIRFSLEQIAEMLAVKP